MNFLSTFSGFVILSFMLSANQPPSVQSNSIKTITTEIVSSYTINHEDYTINLELEKTTDQELALIITMELYNDSYFISPKASVESASGRFYMDLGSYEHLSFNGELLEFPSKVTVKSFYSERDSRNQYVRENTTFKQFLEIKSTEDFMVFGRIQFVVEPRCTLQEIPFALQYKDGEIEFTTPGC